MPAVKEICSVEAGGCDALIAHPHGRPGLSGLCAETVSLRCSASITKNQSSRPNYAANTPETHFNVTNTHPKFITNSLNFH